MKQYRVRQIRKNDLSPWGEMRCALWPDDDQERLRQEAAALLENDGQYCGWLIVDESDHPLGFAEVSVRQFVDGCDLGPAAYLEAIWVTPDQRRRGLARRLVEAIKGWATDQGLVEMGSDCRIDNAAGQAWHCAIGFAETGRCVNYRLKLATTSR